MRERERILQSLEKAYRGAFAEASEAGDRAGMARLDLEYQRDQIHLEVLMDIRELLVSGAAGGEDATLSLLEKAKKIRDLTKLRP